jgi:hypothetical protein
VSAFPPTQNFHWKLVIFGVGVWFSWPFQLCNQQGIILEKKVLKIVG